MSQEIKELAEKLDNAVSEMKDGLERGLEEKTNQANEAITNLSAKLADLEAAVATTQTAEKTAEDVLSGGEIAQKAFFDWARKGVESEMLTKDMSVGTPADGGVLVPEKLDARITEIKRELSPVRDMAEVVTLSGTDRFPLNRQTQTSSAGWVGETAARVNTQTPQFARQEVFSHELYANPKVTLQVLEDSIIDLAEWLAGDVARDMARVENIAFTNGTGTGQPFGITTRGAAAAATPATVDQIALDASGVIAHADLVDLVHDIKPQYRANAKFQMTRNTLAVVRKIVDSTGRPIYDHDYSNQEGFKQYILGYEVMENEDLDDLGSAGNNVAIFGDHFMGYLVFDRLGTSMLRDPYSSKGSVEFYTRKRVGGDVNDGNALRILQDV